MRQYVLTCLFSLGLLAGIGAQDGPPANWFNLDPASSGVPGVGTESLYQRLPAGVRGRPVVVAVIDSGVDWEHEDLKEVMWINEKEIPGNGIDDDKNGYIDDIYGWNFLGNARGENVGVDTYEEVRLVNLYEPKFKDRDPDKLNKREKREYDMYQQALETFEQERLQLSQSVMGIRMLTGVLNKVKKDLGKEKLTNEDLENYKTDDAQSTQMLAFLRNLMATQGMSMTQLQEEIEDGDKQISVMLEKCYNRDFRPRDLVGDDYENWKERGYGNADVRGPDAFHGTHVAGIIAARRGNEVGMDGVADNVRIMAVRTVPAQGDERDKDVANAIYYAVDNGAQVINMSFGKEFSPYKKAVDKAIKYAMKRDVLIVHAAGNEGNHTMPDGNFPNDHFLKGKVPGPESADNMIEVGALNWKGGQELAASFSNYGTELVDVFAPGTAIYSTAPGNAYKNAQGTSMASPVVAGVAAILRSYFPDLTAAQVKDILVASSVRQDLQVKQPGSGELVPFRELCRGGGIVNLERAAELAIKTAGQKRGAPVRPLTRLEPKKQVTP